MECNNLFATITPIQDLLKDPKGIMKPIVALSRTSAHEKAQQINQRIRRAVCACKSLFFLGLGLGSSI